MKHSLIVMVLVFASFSVSAEMAYVQVVDETGMPVSGAMVSSFWFEQPTFSSEIKPGSGSFLCDEKGITTIRLNGKRMVVPDSAAKEGFVFESYLNTNRDFLSGKTDTKTNPRVMVLRRLEPASFLLEVEGDWGRFSKGKSVEFGVDFFHKIRKQWKTPSYDDFFVATHYQEEERRWETVFWTTNANCGLVVTTDRRFTAPETGYTPRVVVSQEIITNKAFTLYLKTRDPVVYAMIPFELSDLQSRGPVGQLGPIWNFHYRMARINPYGGRELERDGRTNGFNSELRDEALQALLKEHRYPPRPDMEARMANCRKRGELDDEILKAREVNADLRGKIKEIEDQMSGKPQKNIDQATEALRNQLKASGDTVRRCTREIWRLEKEAHTLNLPEEGKRE